MNGKRRTGFILAAAILAACTPADDTAEEMPADTAAAMTAPAADVNGTWDMRAVPTSGSDTTSTLYQVQAADGNWTLMLPGRDPMTVQAVTDGDSIMVNNGPYESVRRAGVMVTTSSVFRVSGDQMTGNTVARYQGAGADSVLHLTVTGTRVR
jgi:hypothetical protein